MSAITSIAPAAHVPSGRPRRLTVATTGADDVLVRVLTLLRRRRCRIVAVDFRQADPHGPGRFEVSVEVPARADSALERWLLGLVDVVAVISG